MSLNRYRFLLPFSDVLPVILRALFVSDWDLDEPRVPFEDPETMTREVQALRAPHNFSPDTAIQDVARALRGNIDESGFNEVLSQLPERAAAFWKV